MRRSRSTIWKGCRAGKGADHRLRGERQSSPPLTAWSRPGALLHMNVKKLSRLPGHRATGRRSERNRGVGYDYLHCVIDDHSRLAYVELHPHEDAETNARTLERALRFFDLGLDAPEAVAIARTARSATGHQSAAFTTSVGRTASRPAAR